MKKHGDKKKKKSIHSGPTRPRWKGHGFGLVVCGRDQKMRFGSCLERLLAMADVLREKRNAPRTGGLGGRI